MPVPNAPPHVYGAAALDRAPELRRDERWLAERRADPVSILLPFDGLKVVVTGPEDAPSLAAVPVAVAAPLDETAVFLGLREGRAWFAAAGDGPADAYAIELRAVGALLPAADAALAAYARALMHWHAVTGYCAVCGTATRPGQGGQMRRCPGCGRDHFPRTDAAVIVLVTDGDRCLLGRSARFPGGMYSTLAGFVEAGESLEGCLVREVREEAGIEIGDLSYRSSQPWPFPQSLMVGFRARALTTELRLDPDELEDAAWFTRATLADEARRPVRLPSTDSIARFLIEEWLAEG